MKALKTLILFSCLNNSILLGMDQDEKTHLLQKPLKTSLPKPSSSKEIVINIDNSNPNFIFQMPLEILSIIMKYLPVTDSGFCFLSRYVKLAESELSQLFIDLNKQLRALPNTTIKDKKIIVVKCLKCLKTVKYAGLEHKYSIILQNLLTALKNTSASRCEKALKKIVHSEFNNDQYLPLTNLFLSCLQDIANNDSSIAHSKYDKYSCDDGVYKSIYHCFAVCAGIGIGGFLIYFFNNNKGTFEITALAIGCLCSLLASILLMCGIYFYGRENYEEYKMTALINIREYIKQTLDCIKKKEEDSNA